LTTNPSMGTPGCEQTQRAAKVSSRLTEMARLIRVGLLQAIHHDHLTGAIGGSVVLPDPRAIVPPGDFNMVRTRI
jgi:hypothetical protein